MVTVDSTAVPVRPKRIGKGSRHRRKKRSKLRRGSTRLVKTGKVDLAPCAACGSTQDLTIHHVEPIQPDRFVFLCQECHILAHTPVFRTMEVCIASGHFSIRPEAIVQRADSPTNTSAPVDRLVCGKETRGVATNSPRRKGVCCG